MVTWCHRPNHLETVGMALHQLMSLWSLEKKKHSQWCSAGFIPIEILQVCDPYDCQESVWGCLGNRTTWSEIATELC